MKLQFLRPVRPSASWGPHPSRFLPLGGDKQGRAQACSFDLNSPQLDKGSTIESHSEVSINKKSGKKNNESYKQQRKITNQNLIAVQKEIHS